MAAASDGAFLRGLGRFGLFGSAGPIGHCGLHDLGATPRA